MRSSASETPTKPVADASLLQEFREALVAKVENLKDSNKNGAPVVDEAELKALLEDPRAIGRFLVARNNNLNKACSMAVDCLVWRQQVQPATIDVERDFPIANAQGVWRFAGYAKNGWPIIHVTAGLWDPSKYSVDEYVNMVAFFLETNIRRMDPSKSDNVESQKNFVIFDMHKMAYLGTDYRMSRQMVKLVADYYPERLGIAVVIRTDIFFYNFWKVCSVWADERSRNKVRIFREDYHAFLDEHVGLEHISIELGGTRAEEWPLVSKENQDSFRWSESD